MLSRENRRNIFIEYLRRVGINGKKLEHFFYKKHEVQNIEIVMGLTYKGEDIYGAFEIDSEVNSVHEFNEFIQGQGSINVFFTSLEIEASKYPEIHFINTGDVYEYFKKNHRERFERMVIDGGKYS